MQKERGHASPSCNFELAGVGRKGGANIQGALGAALPFPLTLRRRLALVGQNAELPSDRPLQVWGMLIPHLKGILPMTYQSL